MGPLGSKGAVLGPPLARAERPVLQGPAHRARPAGKPDAEPASPCRSALHEESALHVRVDRAAERVAVRPGRGGEGLHPTAARMSPVSNLWDTLSVRVCVTESSFAVTFLPWLHGHRPESANPLIVMPPAAARAGGRWRWASRVPNPTNCPTNLRTTSAGPRVWRRRGQVRDDSCGSRRR